MDLPQGNVARVEIEGASDEAKARAAIGIAAGEPVSVQKAGDAIRKLWQLGDANDVRLEARSSPQGPSCHFALERRPTYGQVVIHGGSVIDAPELEKALHATGGAAYDPVALFGARATLVGSFGQIHIRGEMANVQYRIDGVQIPEGLSFFGQALQSRLANSVSVLTGSLPAQYGINTAGVIDIQTKTGFTSPGLAVSMYGGSWGWLEPSFSEGGHSGPVDWFITGDYLHNDRGIDNPVSSYGALHDTTNQFHGFAHVSGILDENTRLSLLVGAYSGQFQIPNSPGQPTTPGLSVNGISTFSSAALNENQQESANFGILSLQKHTDAIDAQIALFSRNNYLHFTPDPLGDLLFNGISQLATRSDFATGIQADSSWKVNGRSHAARRRTVPG